MARKRCAECGNPLIDHYDCERCGQSVCPDINLLRYFGLCETCAPDMTIDLEMFLSRVYDDICNALLHFPADKAHEAVVSAYQRMTRLFRPNKDVERKLKAMKPKEVE